MEIIVIAIVVVAAAGIWYYNRNSKSFDVNQDGKVDATDIKVAVQNTVEGVKASADVNKDGKAGAKKAATKAKETVKKTTTRKPKPKSKA